jgi:SAM-dependent methyltransferase
MRRKNIIFTWKNEDALDAFAEWVPFPDAQTSAKEVDAIEKFVGLKPPMFIVDVGCGNGRHAIEFAKRGNRVVGIDVAKHFLDEARRSALNLMGDPTASFKRTAISRNSLPSVTLCLRGEKTYFGKSDQSRD